MKFPQEAKNNPKGSKPARKDSKHLKQNKDKTKDKNSFKDVHQLIAKKSSIPLEHTNNLIKRNGKHKPLRCRWA